MRTDYGDGLFGGHIQEGELPWGSASHPGLEGDWRMAAGTESITLVMVRYGSEEVVLEDRITIRTQVGTPDFVIHPEISIKGSQQGVVVGKRVRIQGAWGNLGDGTYRNYAEVDMTHESDPTRIVSAGTLADVVEGGHELGRNWDKGQFRNKVQRDGFSKSWIPELGGKYTLNFYADPESRWTESNETNNRVTIEIEVRDPRQSARSKDATKGFGFNHHAIADTVAHDVVLAAAASQLQVGPGSTPPSKAIPLEIHAIETKFDSIPSSLYSNLSEPATWRGLNEQAGNDSIDTPTDSRLTVGIPSNFESIDQHVTEDSQGHDGRQWGAAVDSALSTSLSERPFESTFHEK